MDTVPEKNESLAKESTMEHIISEANMSSMKDLAPRLDRQPIPRNPNSPQIVSSSHIPDFAYHGGPVIGQCSLVYTSFWKTPSEATWVAEDGDDPLATTIMKFVSDLLQSDFMNVLSQYGAGSGAGYAGIFVRGSRVVVPEEKRIMIDSDIQKYIQSSINAGVLPEPTPSQVVLIYLSPRLGAVAPSINATLCSAPNTNGFGYHNFFTTAAGNNFYYGVIGFPDDTCLAHGGCTPESPCTVKNDLSIDQRLTQITSHEFAEIVTNPEAVLTPDQFGPLQGGTGWFSPLDGEIGDICQSCGDENRDVIMVKGKSWTVQKIYSRANDIIYPGSEENRCYDGTCLGQASEPIAPLSSPHINRRMPRVKRVSYERLLPLPSIHFDIKTNMVSLNHEEVHRYIQKIFYPLHHENVVTNFPEFLYQIADILGGTRIKRQ